MEAQRACPVPPAIVGRFHSRGDNKPVAPTTTRWAPLTQCRSAYTAVVPFGPGVDGDRASNVDGDRPDHPGGAGQRADRPVGDAPAHTSSAHTKRLLFSRQIVDQHSYVVIGASRIPDEKPFEAKLRCGLMDSEFMARYPREPQQGAELGPGRHGGVQPAADPQPPAPSAIEEPGPPLGTAETDERTRVLPERESGAAPSPGRTATPPPVAPPPREGMRPDAAEPVSPSRGTPSNHQERPRPGAGELRAAAAAPEDRPPWTLSPERIPAPRRRRRGGTAPTPAMRRNGRPASTCASTTWSSPASCHRIWVGAKRFTR